MRKGILIGIPVCEQRRHGHRTLPVHKPRTRAASCYRRRAPQHTDRRTADKLIQRTQRIAQLALNRSTPAQCAQDDGGPRPPALLSAAGPGARQAPAVRRGAAEAADLLEQAVRARRRQVPVWLYARSITHCTLRSLHPCSATALHIPPSCTLITSLQATLITLLCSALHCTLNGQLRTTQTLNLCTLRWSVFSQCHVGPRT